MDKLKQLIHPQPWARAGVAASATFLLTLCLNGTITVPAVSYFAYLYSTYALVILCAWLPDLFRRGKSGAKPIPECLPGKVFEDAPKYTQALRASADC